MRLGLRLKALAGKVLYRLFRGYLMGLQDRTIRTRCLLWHKGKLLLVRNTVGQQRWTLPGGGVKKGEDPTAALKRELYEELKLQPRNLRYHGIIQTPKARRYHCFSGVSATKDFRLHPLELLEARWFTPGKWPTNLSPVVELALAESTEEKAAV